MEIKKHNSQNYEKHYNREERLSMMPESLLNYRNRKKGFFRNNRGLVIIIADIIIICLLFLGYLIHSKLTVSTVTENNYVFSLKGYVFDENALISLNITKKPGTKTGQDTDPLKQPVEIIFTLYRHDSIYKKLYDFMPDNNENEKIYRTSIPVSREYRNREITANAEIRFENSVINLKTALEREN